MNQPVWVLPEIVISIHQMLIAEHGGVLGIREKSLLESALARPQQRFAYSDQCTFHELAASYSIGIAKNHPFIDGNKRVALTVGAMFLEVNGYELNAVESEAVLVFEAVASGEIPESELAQWFSDNSRLLV